MLALMISWSGLKLGHLELKTRSEHKVKSKENHVNTPEVTLLCNHHEIIMLEMFVLIISRSNLKLGHLGKKN